jgi:hypothetical protein
MGSRKMNNDEIAGMVKQNERYKTLLKLFDDHYVCESCDELCATYLDNCKNPLHELHEAAWENEK